MLKAAVDKRYYVLPACHITGVIQTEGVSIVTMVRKFTIFLILSGLAVLIGPPATKADVAKFSDVPVKGMVTMIDLGAKNAFHAR